MSNINSSTSKIIQITRKLPNTKTPAPQILPFRNPNFSHDSSFLCHKRFGEVPTKKTGLPKKFIMKIISGEILQKYHTCAIKFDPPPKWVYHKHIPRWWIQPIWNICAGQIIGSWNPTNRDEKKQHLSCHHLAPDVCFESVFFEQKNHPPLQILELKKKHPRAPHFFLGGTAAKKNGKNSQVAARIASYHFVWPWRFAPLE